MTIFVERAGTRIIVSPGENTLEARERATLAGAHMDQARAWADHAQYSALAASATANFQENLGAALSRVVAGEAFCTMDPSVHLRNEAGELTGAQNITAILRACIRDTDEPEGYRHLGNAADPANRQEVNAKLEAISLNATFAQLRAAPLTIPSSITAVRSVGHRAAGLGAATYGPVDPYSGIAFDADFVAANPLCTFAAQDEDGTPRYFGLTETSPSATMFGLIAGADTEATLASVQALVATGRLPPALANLAIVPHASSPEQARLALDALENWVAARGREARIEDQGHPILLDRGWCARSGNSIVLNARVANITHPVAYDGQGEVVKLGEGHPAYLSPSLAGAQPTFFRLETPQAGASSVTLEAGAERTNGLNGLSVGDGVIVKNDRYYLGAGGFHRYDIVLLTRIARIEPDTGIIALEHSLDEVRGSFSLARTDNPQVKLNNSHYTMEAVFDYTLTGAGALISADSPFSRTMGRNIKIDLRMLYGETGYYFNSLQDCHFHFDVVDADRKLVDVAGNCAGSLFSARTMLFRGSGNGSAAIALNEQSRDCLIRAQTLLAPDYSASSFMNWLYCRRCGIEIEYVFAPSVTTNLMGQSINDSAPEGQTIAVVEGNYCDFGVVIAGAPDRFFEDSGSGTRGFEMRRGRFVGSPGNDIRVRGTGGLITSQVRIESKGLAFLSGASDWTINSAYIADGCKSAGGPVSAHHISGLALASWTQVRDAAVDQTNLRTITSTSAGTPFATMQVPAGALLDGDRIVIELFGSASGTSGTKHIDLSDSSGTLTTLTIPAGSQTFTLRAEVTLQGLTIAAIAGVQQTGSASQTFGTRRSGLDLAGNPLTLSLDAYKASASDGLFIYSHRMVPYRAGTRER